MKLTALRLHGFKSFADRTEIAFHDGITAIVGPNGCGKSNISDAIRWVLGEQRPTAIRGAKMEEAIFQGTVNRRPVNRGSVAMELSNAGGALPVPFEEVEIARTVYRDGGSEYQINRSSCRLRDVHELCRDTGLGANAYSVIENRMIDAILSDRADERRGLFEEAAGIGKYKDRRKAASRRLERAQTDLQRLEDLIGEVQTKVRSLARQKGRAERYGEFRKRRLDLEVSLVQSQLQALQERLTSIQDHLGGGMAAEESLQAEISAAESRVESLRAKRLEVERARAGAAARVEELRTELVRWERETAVAEERAAHAQRRLKQIGEDRESINSQLARAREEGQSIQDERATRGEELEELRRHVASRKEDARAVQERLRGARDHLSDLEARERELARRMAQLEGDAEAARSQAEEMGLRLAHLEEELEEARTALGELRSQGDLFTDRVVQLEEEVERRREAVEEARATVEETRIAVDVARKGELKEQDVAGRLETRLATLRRMERDREGVEPVLKELLADPPEGVLGLLADFLSAPPAVMAAVEEYLGAVSRGVVVQDSASAARLLRWFRNEWEGGGGLILLPLDQAPRPPSSGGGAGTLLASIEPQGEGSPWVKALLHGVDLAEEPETEDAIVGSNRVVTGAGMTRTREGFLILGNPLGATGVLERRGELEALEEEAETARARADGARARREEVQDALQAAENRLEARRSELREAEDAQREARSQEDERTRHRKRTERTVEELDRQIQVARTARKRAGERRETAAREREELIQGSETEQQERTQAREALAVIEGEWEDVRARVSELTVQEARLEGEVERLGERDAQLTRTLESGTGRLGALDREEKELKRTLKEAGETRSRGESETRRLFQLRDEAEGHLREQDELMEEVQTSLDQAEKQVRDARTMERSASEERHRLELEARELEGKIGRIQDRLEGEWGRPLATLEEEADPVQGERQELEEELREVIRKLDRLGPVNMLAVEEHEEESTRLAFLQEQRDDLVEARNDLRSAIREINQTATRLFQETFEGIRENFRETFLRLFQGGECDLWLEDPDDPLESDIEIHASPRGKRTQRIDLLSGGERALTALSLLFGIYLVKPSPFCVLDEVDAPLDESNIGRFIRLLQEFKAQTQFIVVTHNPRTIEAADWIYGVTMEEPGVSSIVGVRLEEALEAAGVGI